MKIRMDYVTNSSSSSFVISKRYIDQDQIEAIRRHSEIGEKLGIECSEECWRIEENAKYIGGYTPMDNFDMEEFLNKIDVDMEYVKWSDSYSFTLPYGKDDWRSLL